MNISPLSGFLLISKPVEVTFKFIGDGKVLHFADDMQSSGVNSWAASDRIEPVAYCFLHTPGRRWVHDPVLTGQWVYFEKWTEKEVILGNVTFCVLPERAVFAYREDSPHTL